MSDPMTIAAIATGITGIVVAILTYIRHSKCGCCECETRNKEGGSETSSNSTLKRNISVIKSILTKKKQIEGNVVIEEESVV